MGQHSILMNKSRFACIAYRNECFMDDHNIFCSRIASPAHYNARQSQEVVFLHDILLWGTKETDYEDSPSRNKTASVATRVNPAVWLHRSVSSNRQ